MSDSVTGTVTAAERPQRRWLGLSGKLMLLTLVFVMLAEVLIFVPSMSNFRINWLKDRLAAAQTAALVIEAAPAEAIPEALIERLLENVGAQSMAMKIGGTRRLLANSETPPKVDIEVDMRQQDTFRALADSIGTLTSGGGRLMRVIGPAPVGAEFIELVLPERPLRQAMFGFAGTVLLLSAFISLLTAALVYATLHWLIVRPVKRLAESITTFGLDAGNPRLLHAPSGRNDEIGDAEDSLAGMQSTLNQQFKQQEHLAALGLAVAKINHDLRNLLSSAQLLSDRIATVPDPTVQRLAPKLVTALDRAIGFCQGTLAFGRAEERAPMPRKFDLAALVNDLRDVMALNESEAIDFVADIPAPMLVRADPDHLLRVLINIARNSVEAMAESSGDKRGRLTITAGLVGSTLEIRLCDNGPGIPPGMRERLFKPFSTTGRPGGTGLGLAIADELMKAQGGSIALEESTEGTCFRLTLPN